MSARTPVNDLAFALWLNLGRVLRYQDIADLLGIPKYQVGKAIWRRRAR